MTNPRRKAANTHVPQKSNERYRQFFCIIATLIVTYICITKVVLTPPDRVPLENKDEIALASNSNLLRGSDHENSTKQSAEEMEEEEEEEGEEMNVSDEGSDTLETVDIAYTEEEEEEELNDAIGDAMSEVEQAEEEEMEANQSKIDQTLQKVEDSVKIALTKIFGDEEEDDDNDDDNNNNPKKEMQEIEKEVTNKLETKVHQQLKDEADRIVDEKEEEILKVVGEDELDALVDRDIEKDVLEVEKKVVEDLKDEIEKVADEIESHIAEEVAEIEVEVIEEHTGKSVRVENGKDGIVLEMEEEEEEEDTNDESGQEVTTEINDTDDENGEKLEKAADDTTLQVVNGRDEESEADDEKRRDI